MLEEEVKDMHHMWDMSYEEVVKDILVHVRISVKLSVCCSKKPLVCV